MPFFPCHGVYGSDLFVWVGMTQGALREDKKCVCCCVDSGLLFSPSSSPSLARVNAVVLASCLIPPLPWLLWVVFISPSPLSDVLRRFLRLHCALSISLSLRRHVGGSLLPGGSCKRAIAASLFMFTMHPLSSAPFLPISSLLLLKHGHGHVRRHGLGPLLRGSNTSSDDDGNAHMTSKGR